jgi:hypothetical protein
LLVVRLLLLLLVVMVVRLPLPVDESLMWVGAWNMT